MDRSVAETGFVGPSPTRNYRSISVTSPLRWLRKGFQELRRSPVESIGWGAGFAVTLFIVTLLFEKSLSAAFIYVAPLVLVAVSLAGGMCASSRLREQGADAGVAAVLGELWRAKFNLFLLGVSVAIMVLLWMRMTTLVYVATTGSLIPVDMSFPDVYLYADAWGLITANVVVTLLTATAIFSLTHLALPMVMDGDRDFMNAMIASLVATIKNKTASLVWASIILGMLVAGLVLWVPLLSLLAPALFFGTWHGYRATVTTE